ncbi:hypothetical protein L210DRAFT_3654452 [Boletus edulis BED1]|uniref:Uncharacterized protein n=1 Tax=Boletus edulis BED1 TaxID=1328754 RepID=A0AAD4BDF4_BOLED|nr:hypothetical protein L210DRAFT_3654452 [Boletus edulis BED1]
MSLLARFRLQGGSRSTGANEGPPDSGGRHSPPRPSSRARSRSLTPSDRLFPTPPPNQGDSRRQRSNSMEDVERQRTLKKQRKYALDACREYQLEDDALDQFAELALPQMLIRVYGKLLAIERVRQKDEHSTFIHSEQFKVGWTFMNRNLPLFKIPAPALDEPGIPDYIDSLMKDILTKQRAMIKNKIALSIKSKQHISLLAKALAQSGYYEVTGSQWARFAFLRQCLVTFNELVMESMARTVKAMGSGQSGNTEGGNSAGNNPAGDNPTGDNSTGGRSVGGGDEGGSSDEPAPRDWVQADFWEFVDIVLCDLRAQAAEEEETLDDQKEHLEKFFTDCLKADLVLYRATKRNCPVPQAASQILSDWQRAIHQELVWS